jgi:hypothetical protein
MSLGKRLPVGRVGEAQCHSTSLFVSEAGEFGSAQTIVVDGGTVLF